jgi:transketolase
MKTSNINLRKEIAWMVYNGKEGHIPSAYSIIDIVVYLYDNILKFDANNPRWEERDYFILSKGHGCQALYAVLKKHGFISQQDIEKKTSLEGILGGHPDRTRVPGIEASTGSLGHGIGMAVGVALGLKIKNKPNKVICLIGDGESNEGTIWESAMVAAKYQLGNLCVIADHNGSSDLVLPVTNPEEKWDAFGWNVHSIDGHNLKEIERVFRDIEFVHNAKPHVVIARTKKGCGVEFMEKNFGAWHAKIPSIEELNQIYNELEKER